MTATIVDSFAFCRLGEQVSGTTPVTGFARLPQELADSSGVIRWRFAGGRHPQGLPQLTMAVDGEVRLVCQRCLKPLDHVIASETVLVLAADEAAADDIEARLEDDSIDVIVGSSSQDLLQLVEDEALLSLPLSPRHEVCPDGTPSVKADKADSPFAVLRQLKS